VVARDAVQHGLQLALGCRVRRPRDGLAQVGVDVGETAVEGEAGVDEGARQRVVPGGEQDAGGLDVEVAEGEVEVCGDLGLGRSLVADPVDAQLGVGDGDGERGEQRRGEYEDGRRPGHEAARRAAQTLFDFRIPHVTTLRRGSERMVA
jgi:hypothetical protein